MPPSRVALGRRPGSACSTTTWRTGSSPSGRSCLPPSPRPDPRVGRRPGAATGLRRTRRGVTWTRRARPSDCADPTGSPASPGRWPRLPPARPPPLRRRPARAAPALLPGRQRAAALALHAGRSRGQGVAGGPHTTTPGGRLVFHVFAALAEFIRELIVEGTREGLDAARARGTRLGRPPGITP